MKTQINKMRMSYTRDIQNLKNALYLAVHPLDSNHAERIKVAIHVYNFNEMEGLDPDLVEFFNEKLQMQKEEA